MLASSAARRVEFSLGRLGMRPARRASIIQRTTALSWSSGAARVGKVAKKSCAWPSTRTMPAAASCSLLEKCLYRLALAMPTLAATWSMVIRSKPFSANKRLAASTMAFSRACNIWVLNDT